MLLFGILLHLLHLSQQIQLSKDALDEELLEVFELLELLLKFLILFLFV